MFSLFVLFNIPSESGLSGASGSVELYRAVATVTVLKLRGQLQQSLPLCTYNVVQNILTLEKDSGNNYNFDIKRSKGLERIVCCEVL